MFNSCMKVIRVNQTKTNNKPSKNLVLTELFLQNLVNKIINNLQTKKIRNSYLLSAKKEITVVFLEAAEIKKINNGFRFKNKSTDILSFTSDDPESMGELLICMSVLKKQSIVQKHSLKAETAYMLIHGILHLLGYDHELSQKEEKLMFKIQDACFSDLGLVQLK